MLVDAKSKGMEGKRFFGRIYQSPSGRFVGFVEPEEGILENRKLYPIR
jgi:hypothetical protein